MFQSLRQNAQIYVFHKDDNPYIELGYVTGVSAPRPKFNMPTTFGTTQETVVDLSANINGQNFTYKNIQATADIADLFLDTKTVVVATSRDAMNAEISNLKQKSVDVINSVERHKQLVSSYDKIILELNPEYAEKQKQHDEINELKLQISELSNMVKTLMKGE